MDLSEDIMLDKNKKHKIDVVIDRLIIKEGSRIQTIEAIEGANQTLRSKVVVEILGEIKRN